MTAAKKIVIATFGSLGDVHPCMALGLELQRRGHQAVIATTEFYREKIAAAGLGFHPIGPNRSPEDPEFLRHVMNLKTGPEFIIRQLLLPALREVYDDLTEATRGADLMVASEIVYAAPLAAEKTHLKWATVILSPTSFFSAYDPSVIAPLPLFARLRGSGLTINRAIVNLGKFTTSKWCEPIYRLRAELGLRPVKYPLFEDKFSPYLNLVLFSRQLASPQPDWPAGAIPTGFVFYKEFGKTVPEKLLNFLSSGPPPIVFTLGSAAVHNPGRFYEESVAAVNAIGRRGVLLVGNNPSPPNLPPEVIAFDYSPFSEIFPDAEAVVHQGGIGTTAQAMRAGRPMLVVPHAFDQPDNAARVERLGIARVIHRTKYTAARVAAELNRLLGDPQVKDKAAKVGEAIRAERGVESACDQIEDLLAR